MARMNNTNNGVKSLFKDSNTTTNHEGAVVHQLEPLEVLFSKVLGSFFGESTFYEKRTAEEDFVELVKTINKVDYKDIEYVLKIALLGREYNMIQYPLSVLTACFNDERFKGQNFVDENGRNKLQYYSNRIVRRGRDIVDIMATQINAFGFDVVTKGRVSHRDLPLPIQLRKALKYKLESFNEYQLSKAVSESREVTPADCIKLLHPDEKRAKVSKGFYSGIIEGNIKLGGDKKQVQSELAKSRNSNSGSTLKDVKQSLDTSTVMAIIKNLVALYRAGVLNDSIAVETICEKLTDVKQIKSSRLLPFRFYSAWKEVNKLPSSLGVRKISDALVKALDLSIDNLQTISGFNAILIDRSGSMNSPVSSMSSLTAEEIALVLGAVCYKKGVGEIYVFANDCKKVTGISSHSTVMDIVNKIMHEYHVGGGTYLDVALNTIARDSYKGSHYDNLILLTDNDCYSSKGTTFSITGWGVGSADDTVNKMLKNKVIKKFYMNNLLGNSFSVINTNDYRKNLITGFSERIVEVVNIYNVLGNNSSDIRKVIDGMIDNLK